jgi:hypothetical protein
VGAGDGGSLITVPGGVVSMVGFGAPLGVSGVENEAAVLFIMMTVKAMLLPVKWMGEWLVYECRFPSVSELLKSYECE